MERPSSHAAHVVAAICLIGAAVGCAGNDNTAGEKGVVSGTVSYTTTTTLPANAEVKVQLQDVSQADAVGMVVAETTLTVTGPQIPFELSYSSDTIDPQHNYAVRATIESDGREIYVTETNTPVITGGNDNNVALTLVSTGMMTDTTGGMGGGLEALEGSSWQAVTILGDAIVANTRPTLDFSTAGKVSGNGTCNDFSGPVTVTGNTLQFGALAATKKACADEAANAQEVKYLAALNDAESYTIDGGTLTIMVRGMSQPLRFTRMERQN
jgi:putative lipoprotein